LYERAVSLAERWAWGDETVTLDDLHASAYVADPYAADAAAFVRGIAAYADAYADAAYSAALAAADELVSCAQSEGLPVVMPQWLRESLIAGPAGTSVMTNVSGS
jgi:hypothetical protein